MPLYEIGESGLQPHAPAQFADLGLYERGDLQRLLRQDISALGDDLLVIAEEIHARRPASKANARATPGKTTSVLAGEAPAVATPAAIAAATAAKVASDPRSALLRL